jgi:tetratricopeptide (TPR) repeat protein
MTASAAFAADAELAELPAARALRRGTGDLAAGRIEQAVIAFRSGLAEAADENPQRSSAKTIAELHFKLGNAGMLSGDLDLAAASYSAALGLQPDMTAGWCNLGNIYQKWDRPRDSIQLYLHALSIDPSHWATRTNLAQALIATSQIVLAKVLLIELATERPQNAPVRHQLGRLYAELNEFEAALDCFSQAVTLNPNDADSLYCLGNMRQKAGDLDGAQAAYVRAAQLQPVICRPAAQSPAQFRVLALFAPFAGNTPTEYLLTGTHYDASTLAVFAGRDYDLAALRRGADLVFNLISDADQAQAVLPMVSTLVDGLGLPTLNPPHKVRETTREIIAQRLDGIAGCRVAKVMRLAPHASSITALEAAASFAMPVLVRPAGTHGGDDFEKLDTLSEAAAFVQRQPDAEHYLIEYLDYRSADGYFRKYRFIFVGDEILPYHLAIGSDWKLHHDSTDMIDHAWMQQEEQTFLADPSVFFSAANDEALRAIRDIIDLEYFGIDCGLDASGNLVVFEVNASMLVHPHNEKFPYKAPYVERIKQVFDAMLARVAQQTRA